MSSCQGRIQRNDDGETIVVNSPSIALIENYLSGGHIKRMILVTEDVIGAIYIKEILRLFAPTVLKNCEVFPMNLGWTEVKDYVAKSQALGIKIFGVLDENKHYSASDYVLAFPENTAPEITFFTDSATKTAIESEFHVSCTQLINSGVDHHELFAEIAKRKDEEEQYVINWCIKQHVKNKTKSYFNTIVTQLNDWLTQCE